MSSKTIFLLLFTGQLRGGGSRERPQSVYEKKFGPVQQCLLSSPPMTQQRSQQVSIGQATVINLVNNKNSSSSPSDVSTPPPLPPRYKKHFGILLPKLFWPTVRKNCSSDRENLLKFEAEGREFAKHLRSLEQFVQTVKCQNNFW